MPEFGINHLEELVRKLAFSVCAPAAYRGSLYRPVGTGSSGSKQLRMGTRTGVGNFPDLMAGSSQTRASPPGSRPRHLLVSLSVVLLALVFASAAQAQVGFGKSTLSGESSANVTSLQFGPDNRLYVASQQGGGIKVYDVLRNGANNYSVTSTETISLIQSIQNHNDDGSVNGGVNNRQVTGILVTGTASNPVIYVSSSDPRIGGGGGSTNTNLDTNSGVLSKLTWSGSSWQKLDLVRGLSRSEENHSQNGMVLSGNTLYLTSGGHTNQGAPSNNFVFLPEYALSGAILSINLGAIGSSTYDLPTLDDEDRAGTNDANDPFGGNNGKNQAILVPGGPAGIHSPGFRQGTTYLFTQSVGRGESLPVAAQPALPRSCGDADGSVSTGRSWIGRSSRNKSR